MPLYKLPVCQIQTTYLRASYKPTSVPNKFCSSFSRSWNRIYWEPRLVYKRLEGKLFGFDTLAVYIKAWLKFNERQSDNPDILDYYGNGELTVKLYTDEYQFVVKARKGLKKDYGNIQIELMHRLSENFSLYAQFWNGYGESLLDYNRQTTRYGIGFALAR